jgi:hypothetical protein
MLNYPRKLVAVLMTVMVRTNKRRWKKVASAGPPVWDSRNATIAGLIPPGSAVLDLGSGAQTLKTYLQRDCFYQPCDVVQSTPDVIVCDFNRGQYPHVNRRFTHVVCSGVLEYIRDHRRFLKEISSLGDNVILSYNVRVAGHTKFERMANNWINHFSREELERVFEDSNLAAERLHTADHGEVIYRLNAAV